MPGNEANTPYQPLEEPVPTDDVVVHQKKTCKERMHRPLIFSIVVAVSLAISSAPAGYDSGVTSTVEKRFQLTSTFRGAQSTFYDVVSLTTVIFVTHFGQSRHRPRVIGCIQLLTGVGMMVVTLPHFLYLAPSFIVDPKGSSNFTDDHMCHEEVEESDLIPSDEEGTSLTNEYLWSFLGSALTSFSSSVLPLAIPYVDDSVNKQATSIYAGIMIGSYSLGSVLGYFLAAVCLSIPAYPSLYHLPDYPKNTGAPNWVGAWWLGYLVLSVCMICIAPLFFFYPKFLPKQGSRKELSEGEVEPSHTVQDDERVQEITGSPGIKSGAKEFIVTMVRSVLRICMNVPVLCLFGAGFLHLASFSGVQVFSALYIQFQFGIQAQMSSLILGIVIVPSGFAGTMFGGYIIKRFGTTRVRIAWIQVLFTTIAFSFDPMGLLVGCPTGDIAGVTHQYNYTGAPPPQPFPEVNSTCNNDCNCKLESYHPVCGEDNLTYVTPCFAGCTENVTVGGKMEFHNCSCVPGGKAYSGECRPFCNTQFKIYAAYGFLSATSITLMTVPGLMLLLRCVTEADRSLAMTLGNMITKIFGQIPAPLVFGVIIDGCCILHQMIKGEEGTCMLYNNNAFRLNMNGVIMGLHFVALVLTIFAALAISIEDRDLKQEKEESESSSPLMSVDETEDDPDARSSTELKI